MKRKDRRKLRVWKRNGETDNLREWSKDGWSRREATHFLESIIWCNLAMTIHISFFWLVSKGQKFRAFFVGEANKFKWLEQWG